MGNKKADAKRAEQLFGSNRVVDVSEKSMVEIIEFEGIRRDIELERLRRELEEIYMLTEAKFERNSAMARQSMERKSTEIMRDYLRKVIK